MKEELRLGLLNDAKSHEFIPFSILSTKYQLSIKDFRDANVFGKNIQKEIKANKYKFRDVNVLKICAYLENNNDILRLIKYYNINTDIYDECIDLSYCNEFVYEELHNRLLLNTHKEIYDLFRWSFQIKYKRQIHG